jgi:hypothetical protein
VGWALVGPDNDADVAAVARAPRALEQAPTEPSTATLVESAPVADAPVTNPFEGTAGADADADAMADVAPQVGESAGVVGATAAVASTTAPGVPKVATNPFNTMGNAPQRAPAVAAAPRSVPVAPGPTPSVKATATAPRPAAPRKAGEPDLLQTLMQNIQQTPEPPRDTQSMDRLARRLDRAPMPASTEANAAPGTVVATAAKAPAEKQSLRAMLDQCPSTSNTQARQCRKQMCQRAGVDPRHCVRH